MIIKVAVLLVAVSLCIAGRPQNINVVNSGTRFGSNTIGSAPNIVIGAQTFEPSSGSRPSVNGNIGSGPNIVLGGQTFGPSSGSRPNVISSTGFDSNLISSSGSRHIGGNVFSTGFGSSSTGSRNIIGSSQIFGGTGDPRSVIGGDIVIAPGNNPNFIGNTGFITDNIRSGSVSGSTFGSTAGSTSGNVFNFQSTDSTQFVNRQGQGSQNGQNFGPFVPQLTLTVTETTTIDSFVTVTDLILNSVPVTLTGFNIATVTITTLGAHQTAVDDIITMTTTVVERPLTEFVTVAKSNFVYVTEISREFYTITHSDHLIQQTTHTTVLTQTLTMSSPVVRTHLTTSVATSTELNTIINTVFVHGYQ